MHCQPEAPWRKSVLCLQLSQYAYYVARVPGQRTGKCFDLFANHVDTTIVTGVQLQHHLAHVFAAIDPTGECENSRGLAGSGRAIEEEVRETLLLSAYIQIQCFFQVIHWLRQND